MNDRGRRVFGTALAGTKGPPGPDGAYDPIPVLVSSPRTGHAVVCLGGPNDGERIVLSDDLFRTRRFKVTVDRDIASIRDLEEFTYEIVFLKDGDGKKHFVALPQGERNPIARLIAGYAKQPETVG